MVHFQDRGNLLVLITEKHLMALDLNSAPSASPRNTLVGHTIGVAAGYVSLLVTGLTTAGPALAIGVTWPRVIAAALSLGLTAGLMILCKSPHPSAGQPR